MKILTIFLLTLVIAFPLRADIPNSIPHQGRVAVGSTNFDGTGQFKFLLFGDEDADHSSGNELAIWSNTTTAPADMTEPAAAVPLTVTKGLYSVWLGDTDTTNMAALPTSFDPSDKQLYLRLWFDDGTNGSQQLSPDQKIASAAYALLAANSESATVAGLAQSVQANSITSVSIAANTIQASDIAAGAVGSSEIADGSIAQGDIMAGAVTTAKLADDAVTQDKLAPGAATGLAIDGDSNDQRVAVQGSGSVVIGAHATTAVPAPVLVPLDSDGTNLDFPRDIAVQGDFVYVVDSNMDVIQIFNVADPNNIVPQDSDATNISNPVALGVEGDFAYVVDSNNDVLQVFNISNPASIAALGSIAIGSSPVDIAVQSKIVYVVDDTTGTLEIYDATDPNSIMAKGAIGTNLVSPTALAVNGNFAYVVDEASDRLQIFDVSDVNSIIIDDFDQTNMSRPKDIAVVGNFAYVVFGQFLFPAGLQIFDVSNPASITALDSDSTNLQFPVRVSVQNGRAFVTESSNTVGVLDVSNPGEIVPGIVDDVTLTFPRTLAVAGDFAYVGNATPGRLQIFRIAPAAGIAGSFSVSGQSSFAAVSLSGGLVFPDGSIQTEAATNQQLSLAGNTLSISDGNDVNLASIDDQTLFLIGDTLSIAGGNSADLGQYLRDDGSEPVGGNLTINGDITATDHNFSSTQTFARNISGNSLVPREGQSFFRSELGFIRQNDAVINLYANVQLPQGATVTAAKLLFYDNSSAGSFTDLRIRFRRRALASTATGNIGAIDQGSPPTSASTTVRTQATTIAASRAVIDNQAYHYFMHVDATNNNPGDSNLRIYGFEILYTLDTLAP